ncbi:MAG: nucleotidyltransferase substrate binding protein [Oscillospiraceae bacterium]|nr:nucleotidyltransferase substrate binding protein [Oscillospiraceae bacterium]
MKFDEKLNISDMVKCAENFKKTIARALKLEARDPKVFLGDENDYSFEYQFARSAVIQVFETTIESAWKIMQRWIKINADSGIAEKPKRELFRIAHNSGLIADPESWWNFYAARNKTSHTYHEEIAEEVYVAAKQFEKHLTDFIKRLEERR